MPKAIEVTGLDPLLRKLSSLPTRVQGKVVRPAARDGTKIVAEEVKRLVPVDADGHQLDGGQHLRKTIKVRAVKGRRRGSINYKVMTGTREELGIPAGEKGYYPAALEYGGLDHQPIPYMRPALRRVRPRVISSVRSKILAGIMQEAARGS